MNERPLLLQMNYSLDNISQYCEASTSWLLRFGKIADFMADDAIMSAPPYNNNSTGSSQRRMDF